MDEKEDASQVFVVNGSAKKKEETLQEKFKDKHYRKRVLQSFLLSLSSLTLGVVFGQQGPTFLDLQIITDTDVQSASFFFTAGSLGYMVGSFVSGLVHGKVNNHVLMAIANAGAGVAAIITPYCSPYTLMLFIRFSTNSFCGAIDTLVNAEHMSIWGGQDGRALLQGIHFTFALGGVLTPLFTEPFLAPKVTENETLTSDNFMLGFTEDPQNWTDPFLNETNWTNQTAGQPQLPRTTNVHYAFLISGTIAILFAIPYIIMACINGSPKGSSQEKHAEKVHSRKLPLPIYIFMLVVLCFFYFVYCCVEDTFASYLMTFVVSEYSSITKSQGAYITMFYWASFAAGRFGSIFVSKYLTGVRLIYLYSFLMVVAFTGFTIGAFNAAIDALTAFACLAGIGMSAVFPAGFSWCEAELFKVTGWVSSFFLIGSSLGMMVNPMIIGYLMKYVSNMWFCYILMGESFLLCAVFVFLLMFNRCYVDKRYGTLGKSRTLELQVDSPLD